MCGGGGGGGINIIKMVRNHGIGLQCDLDLQQLYTKLGQ